MVKDLIEIADKLDKMGLNKDASFIDGMIEKLGQFTYDSTATPMEHLVSVGDTMTSMTAAHTASTGKSLADNIELNKSKDPAFDPDHLKENQIVWLWCDGACEAS